MQNVFIEVTNGPQNWGKFMVARFDEEWQRKSAVLEEDIVPAMRTAHTIVPCPTCGSTEIEIVKAKCLALPHPHQDRWHDGPQVSPLLRGVGWDTHHIIVFDLQTCEGAAFRPGGSAKADLDKHKIWVCPMFEPFLKWLYKQDLADLTKLPRRIDLPDAPFAMAGYRRQGGKNE